MTKKVMMVAVVLGVAMSMAVGSPALAAGSDGVVLTVAKSVVRRAAFKTILGVATGPVGAVVAVGSFCLDAYGVGKAACDTIF